MPLGELSGNVSNLVNDVVLSFVSNVSWKLITYQRDYTLWLIRTDNWDNYQQCMICLLINEDYHIL